MAQNTGVSNYVFPEEEVYVSPNGYVVEPSKEAKPNKVYAGETSEGVLKKLVRGREIVADEWAKDLEELRGEGDSFITESQYNMFKNIAESAMSGNRESMEYLKVLLGGM